MIQHMSRHICMSIKPMTKVACLLLLKKRIALIHIAVPIFRIFLLLILCSFIISLLHGIRGLKL
jgi:hypothetical protein